MIEYKSYLPLEMKEQLESLLFFNPEQQRVLEGIISSIDNHGNPTIIISSDNKLRVKVGDLPEVQNLFAVIEENGIKKVIGIMLYYRVNVETISVLHISVSEDYLLNSNNSEKMVLINLILKLKEISKSLKGVKKLKIFYQGSKTSNIII